MATQLWPPKSRVRARLATLPLTLALLAGCKSSETAQAGKPENPQTWAPAKLTSVNGVPATEIEARMKEKLNSERPPKIDDDQWGHTKRLYQIYGDNALWLSSDGLHETRTKALTDAILAANTDGLKMDDYPIGALAQAIATLKQTKNPTADQLATADVLLTASYVALGEDLMTGQIDPRTVQQAWHVNPEEENIDSALVRNLRYEHLDRALATMRPTDDDYAGLSKELQRWRLIVAKGGWSAVPAPSGNVKPGSSASPALLTALRARLAAEGFTVAGDSAQPKASATTYDRGLAEAVAAFQTRHSINV